MKYKTIRFANWNAEEMDEMLNDMFNQGYRLHTVLTIPPTQSYQYAQFRYIFESMEILAQPIMDLNRKLEVL